MECGICLEDVTYLVKFDCTHGACLVCTPKLKKCPWCETTIENEPFLPEVQVPVFGLCTALATVITFTVLYFTLR
jgi:hypothetical protein